MTKTDDGIWGHSKPYEEYMIFALIPHDMPVPQRMERMAAFAGWASKLGIGYKSVIGRYTMKDGGGVCAEFSLVVAGKHFPALYDDGWLTGEESVLCLREYDARDRRKAVLHFIEDGREEEIGYFGGIREHLVGDRDFTYDPHNDQYYVVMSPEEWHDLHIHQSNSATRK